MEQKKSRPVIRLTNEEILKKFSNQFDLVRYAIELGQNIILSGREPRVKMDCQNVATQALQEILVGKDVLEPLNPETLPPRRNDKERRSRSRE